MNALFSVTELEAMKDKVVSQLPQLKELSEKKEKAKELFQKADELTSKAREADRDFDLIRKEIAGMKAAIEAVKSYTDIVCAREEQLKEAMRDQIEEAKSITSDGSLYVNLCKWIWTQAKSGITPPTAEQEKHAEAAIEEIGRKHEQLKELTKLVSKWAEEAYKCRGEAIRILSNL